MVDTKRIVDLREEPEFIEQYVNLRNSNCDLLLTTPVEVEKTKAWLNENNDTEIRCLVSGEILLGVAILYIRKKGEIAFFSAIQNSGIGSQLLQIIEQAARERGLKMLWAWVLTTNHIAKRVFIKNGFQLTEESTKEYQKNSIKGYVFNKTIHYGEKQ